MPRTGWRPTCGTGFTYGTRWGQVVVAPVIRLNNRLATPDASGIHISEARPTKMVIFPRCKAEKSPQTNVYPLTCNSVNELHVLKGPTLRSAFHPTQCKSHDGFPFSVYLVGDSCGLMIWPRRAFRANLDRHSMILTNSRSQSPGLCQALRTTNFDPVERGIGGHRVPTPSPRGVANTRTSAARSATACSRGSGARGIFREEERGVIARAMSPG